MVLQINRQYIILGILGLILFGLMIIFLPPAYDWHEFYIPATKEFIAGKSPFNSYGFFNAPWLLIPFIPLIFLPEPVSRAILALATLSFYGYTAYRLGAKFPAIVLILISPPVILNVYNGNVDWLVALGFILPPNIGLFFLAIKPQIGSAVALFWLVNAWRTKGAKEALKIFAPVSITLTITFILYGFWPKKFLEFTTFNSNFSLWPFSIPIGLSLIVASLRKKSVNYAIGASPCLSPKVTFQSWSVALLALSNSIPELAAAVLGLWLFVVIRGINP
jgi:hypothetical protein